MRDAVTDRKRGGDKPVAVIRERWVLTDRKCHFCKHCALNFAYFRVSPTARIRGRACMCYVEHLRILQRDAILQSEL